MKREVYALFSEGSPEWFGPMLKRARALGIRRAKYFSYIGSRWWTWRSGDLELEVWSGGFYRADDASAIFLIIRKWVVFNQRVEVWRNGFWLIDGPWQGMANGAVKELEREVQKAEAETDRRMRKACRKWTYQNAATGDGPEKPIW